MVPSVATTASDLFYGRIQVQWRLPPLGIGVWRQGKVVHRIRALKGVRTEIELAPSFLRLDAVKRIARKAARYCPRVARVLTSQKASADVGEKKRQPHKTELCHALVTSKILESVRVIHQHCHCYTALGKFGGMVENKELSALDAEDHRQTFHASRIDFNR